MLGIVLKHLIQLHNTYSIYMFLTQVYYTQIHRPTHAIHIHFSIDRLTSTGFQRNFTLELIKHEFALLGQVHFLRYDVTGVIQSARKNLSVKNFLKRTVKASDSLFGIHWD